MTVLPSPFPDLSQPNSAYISPTLQSYFSDLSRTQQFSFSISISETKGRVLRATQDIQAGTLMLKEAPFVLIPDDLSNFCALCVKRHQMRNCREFRLLLGLEDNKGLKKWLLSHEVAHYAQTKKYSWHRIIGAVITLLKLQMHESMYSTAQAPYQESALPEDLHCLTSKHFSAVLTLDDGRSTNAQSKLRLEIASDLQNMFGLDSQLLSRILSILDLNSHQVLSDGEFTGLFCLFEMLEHNCVENCCWYYSAIDGQVEVRTITDVKAGENLSIAYCPLMDAQRTREYTERNYQFVCSCERCSGALPDVARSFRCPSCGNAVALRNTTDKLEGGCDKCNHNLIAEEIDVFLQAENKLESLAGLSHEERVDWDFIERFCRKVVEYSHCRKGSSRQDSNKFSRSQVTEAAQLAQIVHCNHSIAFQVFDIYLNRVLAADESQLNFNSETFQLLIELSKLRCQTIIQFKRGELHWLLSSEYTRLSFIYSLLPQQNSLSNEFKLKSQTINKICFGFDYIIV